MMYEAAKACVMPLDPACPSPCLFLTKPSTLAWTLPYFLRFCDGNRVARLTLGMGEKLDSIHI